MCIEQLMYILVLYVWIQEAAQPSLILNQLFTATVDQFPISSCRWLQWLETRFYRDSLNLVFNLTKYRRDLNLQQYSELWIYHIHIGIHA